MNRTRTPTARWIARVIGVALAFGLMVLNGLSLASQMAHERTETTRPLPAGVIRFDAIDIPGDLAIRGTARGPHRIVQTAHTGIGSPDVTISVVGDTLIARAECRWYDPRCGVDLDAAVDSRGPIEASSTGGDVEVSDVDGPLTLTSSGGEIRVQNAGGDLRLSSSAGGVTVRDAAAGQVAASSSAGDVHLELVTPPRTVVAESSAGDVELLLPAGPTTYRVDAETSAGQTDVQVRVDPASTNVIRVSSSGGDVTIRYAAD